ncbi:putative basic-leucine zipper transcription factor [Tieghemostelium lacteum]|uniref:Putative basic-leucine zipper transcription factor n=1 Tax=Tieghemostelium lacteum TaxID=361077 RepID=A0A151ZRL8_TIELA|nr:putative basic-leucine zipper transcription factor [Tieghemostelium lacteum]|eukprot:KYQ96643.1 putative basic-leucine zipper transcription factor [Tieghemostelium lacteum]
MLRHAPLIGIKSSIVKDSNRILSFDTLSHTKEASKDKYEINKEKPIDNTSIIAIHSNLIDDQCACCMDSETFFTLMQKENPYIQSGFREHTNGSFWNCTKSIFQLHNDTFNIWTHLLGALYYLCFIINWLLLENTDTNNNINNNNNTSSNNSTLPKIYLFYYLLSCFFCFTASTIYHTYRSHSIQVFKRTLMFDVSAIALVILAAVNLILNAELQCYPTVRRLYLFSFLFLIFLAIYMLPIMMRNKKYTMRTAIFSTLALQGLASHLLKIYLNQSISENDLKVTVLLLLSYTLFGMGLTIRRLQIPEKLQSHTFDIYLSSHQIFHVLVLLGTISILYAFKDSYIYQQNKECQLLDL